MEVNLLQGTLFSVWSDKSILLTFKIETMWEIMSATFDIFQ